MSDDEYFDNDDLFTSTDLDSIPLLNQPSDPIGPGTSLVNVVPHRAAPTTHNTPGTSSSNPIVISERSSYVAWGGDTQQHARSSRGVQQQNPASTSNVLNHATQPSGSRRPTQASGRPPGSRFSAIMNALRASTQAQPSSCEYYLTRQTLSSVGLTIKSRSTARILQRLNVWCSVESPAIAYSQENHSLQPGEAWLSIQLRRLKRSCNPPKTSSSISIDRDEATEVFTEPRAE
jgi:hypothetical protein